MFPGESCWNTGGRPTFGRSADLRRHYIHLHTRQARFDGFYCDYKNCTRKKEPFTQKDHYRDHLRDFHKEDLPRPNTGRKAPRHELYMADREITSQWWRCPKCLERVDVSTRGWKCCGFECELSRQKTRVGNVADADKMDTESTPQFPNSVASSYTTSQFFNSQPTYSDYNTGSMMPSQSQTTSYWPMIEN
jgi:hypothetical protein